MVNVYIFGVFSIFACGNQEKRVDKSMNYTNKKLSINADIVKYVEKKDSHKMFIYGNITIENISIEKVIVNLGDVFLRLSNGEISSKIYIDSIASIIIQDIILNIGQKISYDVYWFFENPLDISDIELFFNNEFAIR